MDRLLRSEGPLEPRRFLWAVGGVYSVIVSVGRLVRVT